MNDTEYCVSETASVCRGWNTKPSVVINFCAKYIGLMSHRYFAYTWSFFQHLFHFFFLFSRSFLFFPSCKIGSFSKMKFALRQEYNYFSTTSYSLVELSERWWSVTKYKSILILQRSPQKIWVIDIVMISLSPPAQLLTVRKDDSGLVGSARNSWGTEKDNPNGSSMEMITDHRHCKCFWAEYNVLLFLFLLIA